MSNNEPEVVEAFAGNNIDAEDREVVEREHSEIRVSGTPRWRAASIVD